MISRAGIKVAMTTTGSVTPGNEELREPYRWRKIPDWTPGDPRYREESSATRKKAASAGGAAIAEGRRERFREFCELRTEGVGVFEAGARVGVKQRAARRYEQQRLAGKEAKTS